MWLLNAFNLVAFGHTTNELEKIEYLSSRFKYLESQIGIEVLMEKYRHGLLDVDGRYLNLMEEQYNVLTELQKEKSKYRGFMNFDSLKQSFFE